MIFHNNVLKPFNVKIFFSIYIFTLFIKISFSHCSDKDSPSEIHFYIVYKKIILPLF